MCILVTPLEISHDIKWYSGLRVRVDKIDETLNSIYWVCSN